MTLLDSLKPFLPLLFTFVLPRAYSYYVALRQSVRTRPPPRPLSAKASRSLNILFVSICLFLWLSYSTNAGNNGLSNVFSTTNTRLGVPSELLFSRLALQRPNGMLTAEDEELRASLTNMPTRQIYLRVGPTPILRCPFCHPDDPNTYILHALPTQILFPHLIHLLLLGLATSKSVSGAVAANFRYRATFTAIAVALFDLYLIGVHELKGDTHTPGPFSLYQSLAIFRPLAFCIIDAGLAFLVYATATNRFVFFPFLAAASDAADGEPEELIEQTKSLLHDSNNKMQMTLTKLRGMNVTQNTIRRDESLKRAEDEYWRTVRQVENKEGWTLQAGGPMDPSLFEEEEVQAAVARAFGSGNVDVAGMRREAEAFVREVTRGLDRPRQQS